MSDDCIKDLKVFDKKKRLNNVELTIKYSEFQSLNNLSHTFGR